MQRPSIVLTLSSLLLGACGGDKNESESESTGASTGAATTTASDTDSTIGMSSSPTTTSDDGSGTSNPTTEDGGSATTTTTTTTSATETSDTTDGDPDIMQLCATWCGKNAACNRESDPDGCVADCVGELGGGEPLCADATKEMLACMLDMTCEEFAAFIDKDEPGPCAPELDAVENACADEVCTASGGGNPDGTECSYSVDCPDQPFREVQCDADTCTCLEDGKKVGTCEADDVCTDPGDLPAKAAGCCGF